MPEYPSPRPRALHLQTAQPPAVDPGASLPAYEDIDALLRGAKDQLAHADTLSRSVPARFGGTGFNAEQMTPPQAPHQEPAEKPFADESLWGKVKRVAGYSPLPEDIGERFIHDVDPQEERDRKANAGNYGAWDTVKSGLANTGGAFLDLLRGANTPVGLASLPAGGEGTVAHVLGGASSAVFAGEGAEQAFDSSLPTGQRVLGGLTGLLGGLGVAGSLRPHAPAPRTGAGARGGFSPFEPTAPPPVEKPIPVSKYSGPKIPPRLPREDRYVPNRSAASHAGDPAAGADIYPPTFEPYAPNLSTPRPELPPAAGADTHPPVFEQYAPNRSGYEPAIVPSPEPAAPAPVQEAAAVDTPPPVSAKPRIAADEFAQVLKGRQKFAETNPGVELPPGVRDEMDRSGLEYGRTQSELKRLLGLPDADPLEVGRMKQGARELGSRLRKTAKGATETPPPPAPSSLTEMLQASIAEQEGAPRPGRMTLPKPRAIPKDESQYLGLERRINGPDRVGGGLDRRVVRADPAVAERLQQEMAVTDATPAPPPPDDLDPLLRNLLYGEEGSVSPELLMMLAKPAAGAAIGGVFGDPEHRGRDMAIGAGLGAAAHAVGPERLRYASMLTGTAQAKNIVGDLGVVGHTAAERAMTHGPSKGLDVLREFFSPKTADDYVSMLKGDTDVSLARLDRPESASSEGVMGLPFRTMGAADTATQNALSRAGIEDAAERTFTGDPKTKIGQSAMRFQREGGAFARTLVPFMKTAVNQAEAAVLPFTQLSDPTTRKQALAKIGLLGAGAAAGAAYGQTDFAKSHPKTSALIAAGAGPSQVPFALGQAGAIAARNANKPIDWLVAMSKAAAHQLPLPSDWSMDPRQWAKSLAPAGLDLVNPDDVPRDTSAGVFDPLIARIPGLSSTLPAKTRGRARTFRNE